MKSILLRLALVIGSFFAITGAAATVVAANARISERREKVVFVMGVVPLYSARSIQRYDRLSTRPSPDCALSPQA